MATSTRNENHLLAALSDEEFSPLESWLELISLPRGEVLARPGEPIEHAYFPTSGMVSIVALMSKGLGAEVATVGNEGMIGLPIYLGAASSPFHLMAQLSGQSLRIPARQLEKVLVPGARLTALLRTYSQAFFVQTAQNAACNGIHPISMRAARWLLATHDRAETGLVLPDPGVPRVHARRHEAKRRDRGRRPRRPGVDFLRARADARSSIAPASNVRHASATASFARSSIGLLGIARA